jgi:hypothetical protein
MTTNKDRDYVVFCDTYTNNTENFDAYCKAHVLDWCAKAGESFEFYKANWRTIDRSKTMLMYVNTVELFKNSEVFKYVEDNRPMKRVKLSLEYLANLSGVLQSVWTKKGQEVRTVAELEGGCPELERLHEEFMVMMPRFLDLLQNNFEEFLRPKTMEFVSDTPASKAFNFVRVRAFNIIAEELLKPLFADLRSIDDSLFADYLRIIKGRCDEHWEYTQELLGEINAHHFLNELVDSLQEYSVDKFFSYIPLYNNLNNRERFCYILLKLANLSKLKQDVSKAVLEGLETLVYLETTQIKFYKYYNNGTKR